MSYKSVINRIKYIVDNHKYLQTFGYGDISDINTPEDLEAPDYPYVFLNPVSVVGDKRSKRFNMNLIIMEITYDKQTNIYETQDLCITLLNEILSYINDDTPREYNIITPYTITPFKERFSDDVVGITANLTFEYQEGLNNCDNIIENG